MTFDDPKYINEYQTKNNFFLFLFFCFCFFVFVFLFFFVLFFCFFVFCLFLFFVCLFVCLFVCFLRRTTQSRPNAILAQSNRKNIKPPIPNGSLNLNPGSKPIGGTKGVTNLTGSSGMRARHHHTKGDKSETNRDDRN